MSLFLKACEREVVAVKVIFEGCKIVFGMEEKAGRALLTLAEVAKSTKEVARCFMVDGAMIYSIQTLRKYTY